MASATQKNICFYSNKCDWSKAFIKEIAGTSLKAQFNYICVDPDANTGRRPNLPAWLKKVPTLVIQGDQEPIKTDAEVMNWLYITKMRMNPGGGTNTPNFQLASAEPDAWMASEMGGGLKDSYGFLDDQGGMISHNFEIIGDGGNGGSQASMPSGIGTRTGSEMPAAQKTQKEQLFDKQMDSYMRNRDTGMPQQRPRS